MSQVWLMTPAPGERTLRFVGDRLEFSLGLGANKSIPAGWRAFLRTNLGRGSILRQEIIHAHSGRLGLAHSAWRDIPMGLKENQWSREITLCEVGYFRAKAYAMEPEGRQPRPEGPDAGIS